MWNSVSVCIAENFFAGADEGAQLWNGNSLLFYAEIF